MNTIVSIIVVTSVILLIYALLMQRGRDTNSETLQEEVYQRLGDENCQRTHQPEPESQPNEKVTPSLTTTVNRSRCPACGATITANDERCPSCDIAFVAEGSQKWTLGAVGPADGIYLPPTEVRE
jgi:hypothetical protein